VTASVSHRSPAMCSPRTRRIPCMSLPPNLGIHLYSLLVITWICHTFDFGPKVCQSKSPSGDNCRISIMAPAEIDYCPLDLRLDAQSHALPSLQSFVQSLWTSPYLICNIPTDTIPYAPIIIRLAPELLGFPLISY
jgi:hypothetical protein